MIIKYRYYLYIKGDINGLRNKKFSELDDDERFALDAEEFCEIVRLDSGYNFFITNKSPRFDEFCKILIKHKRSEPNDCEFVYSNEELSKVEYFSIRPTWRNGYPYFEKDYLTRSFAFEESSKCDCRAIQTNPISINRYPKWTNRHFMGLFWLHDIVFCDNKIKDLCTENNICGLEFQDVFYRNKEVPLVDVFQMKVSEFTNIKLVGFKLEIVSAEICKKSSSLKVYFSKDYINKFNQTPMNLESDIFYIGDRFNSRNLIISKKFYLLLKDNKYLKGLDVQPVFAGENIHLIRGVKQLDSYSSLSIYYRHNKLYKSQDEHFWNIYPGREEEVSKALLYEYYLTFLD